MNTKAINSRVDAVTKDMQPAQEAEQMFHFPSLGLNIKAVTYQEALEKAKVLFKETQAEQTN